MLKYTVNYFSITSSRRHITQISEQTFGKVLRPKGCCAESTFGGINKNSR